MNASEKRKLAAKCLPFAIQQKYKEASAIRQSAYAKDPPGTIGVDWNDFPQIWEYDARYLMAMNDELFNDLSNSENFINLLRAGLYVDNLFGFTDFWSVNAAVKTTDEVINCPALDKFLRRMDWPRDNKLFIYCSTKKKNILAFIYKNYAVTSSSYAPQQFSDGEYDLGFLPGTPKKVIDARREWLKGYNLFEDMQKSEIHGFPKTFNTFEKHYKANDAKYLFWVDQYKNQ